MIVPSYSANCRCKRVDYVFHNLRKEGKFNEFERKMKIKFRTKRQRRVRSRMHTSVYEYLHTGNMLRKCSPNVTSLIK